MLAGSGLVVVIVTVATLVVLDRRGSETERSGLQAGLGRNVLAAPIEPEQQTKLAFPQRSHWLQPWRAYLDTQPASRVRAALGINFDVPPELADATARLLARSGFKRARIEIGWSEISLENPARLKNPEAVRTTIGALKRHGIRPLVLLNANHGAPGPTQLFDVVLTKPATAGARKVSLDRGSAAGVRAGRTGLNQGDKAAGILFTRVGRDGTAELSKPLPGALPAGPQKAATLGYAPFQRPKTAGGSPNRAFEATMRGWLDYVGAVTRETKSALGSDAFDVEVWNELSFGAEFLDAGTYYERPPPGQGDQKREILNRTVSWLRDPAHGVAKVRIGDGFASQTPFAAGSTSPPGLTAIDKHPYPKLRQFPDEDQPTANQEPLDARGESAGVQDATGRWRDRFTPRYRAFFPEYYLTAIQAETLVRDLSPITSSIGEVTHGRDTAPEGSASPSMWITELNLDLSGGDPSNPTAPRPGTGPGGGEGAEIQAKGVLRAMSAYVSKGVSAIDFYAARDPKFALIPGSFYEAVAGRGGKYPGAGQAGATLNALRRYLHGFEGPAAIEDRRELRLEAVGDDHGHRQFDGDGSAAHPPLHNREVLAFFPFQVTDRRFVAPVYVMTRDLGKPLSPERYRLQIKGVGAVRARVSATDPLTGRSSPARIISRSDDRLVVEVEVTDSPRLLLIDD